ncbi:MAG: histidine kinase [Treponema sp.]|nr:histidine kinase [Treponema sp.]
MKKRSLFLRIKSSFKKKSLISQLSIFVIALMTIILIDVISFTYIRSSHQIINQYVTDTKKLLALQGSQLDSYFSQLESFSLHLRSDQTFMELISTQKPLSYFASEYLKTRVRNEFYFRNDLLDFSLYDVAHDTSYKISRTQTARNLQTGNAKSIYEQPNYKIFSSGLHYKDIVPAKKGSEKEGLFTFYRTIINIHDKKPLAFVTFTVDKSWPDSNIGTGTENEITILADQNETIFYQRGCERTKDFDMLVKNINSLSDGNLKPHSHTFIKIKNQKFMMVKSRLKKSGWIIINLIPKKQVYAYTESTRNIGFFLGFFSILISTLLISVFIRLFTHPLSVLADQLKSAGEGNFKTIINIQGCKEISLLSDAFNNMILKIDDLIAKNYISDLAKKNAQLVALKAQMNPHFLYNTLQTISAEAIENDQEKINDMVMALSSMLKYTIRGDDSVTLRTEIEHAKDYLFLQKERFGERLSYNIKIDEDLQFLMIPKISVLNLVENAVVHGMSHSAEKLHIEISAEHQDSRLTITVTDDGNGISINDLEEIQRTLNAENWKIDGNAIGLKNLSNRLKIMYGDEAKIHIYSTQFTGTSVVMELAAKEVK